jgi:hypothetical protein
MKKPIALCLATVAVFFAHAVRCEEADTTEGGVLGGSPPIYASEMQAPLETSTYKRYRAVPRGPVLSPGASPIGSRCATRGGLFGPGASWKVDTTCIGRSPDGKLYRGHVVPDGNSRFCVTAIGVFGPGAEQPLGMPCSGETKNGAVQGQIAIVE